MNGILFIKEPEERSVKKISALVGMSRCWESFFRRYVPSDAELVVSSASPGLPRNEVKLCIKYSVALGDVMRRKMTARHNGVDVFSSLNHHIISEVFSIVKKVAYAKHLISDKKYEKVYVQNLSYGFGRIVKCVADSMDIECLSIEPSFYGHLKQYARNKIGRKMYIGKELDVDFKLYHRKGDGKRVFFFSNQLNMIRNFEPVIKIGGFDSYLLSRDHSDLFKETVKTRRASFLDAGNIVEDLKGMFAGVTVPLFNGTDISSLVSERVFLALDSVPGVVRMIDYLDGLLPDIKPSLVVVGDDRVVSGRTVVLLAKKYKIPSMEIPHGFDFYNAPMGSPVVDKIAVGGMLAGQVFERFGSGKGRLVVTGWPKYDKISAGNTGSSGNGKGADILFASQPLAFGLVRESVNRLYDACLDAEARLVIKPHPGDWNELIKYYSTFSEAELHTKYESIYPLIERCNALVTFFSTAATDAIIIGKPVIIINCGNEYHLGSYLAESGVALEIKDLSEMGAAIKTVLSRDYNKSFAKKRERFIKDFAFMLDGQSSIRISELMKKIAK